MKKLFALLIFSYFAQEGFAQNRIRENLKIDLLLGGRWQSEEINLPIPDGIFPLMPILPYFAPLNIQGFGMVGGTQITFMDRLSASFKPVLRYDYFHSDPMTLAPIKAWLWDLHFNLGWKFKKNTVGLGYTLINAGKFMMVTVPPAPTIKMEFPCISIFYTREIKKRFIAELKILYNYRDFPTHTNPYNIPYEIYQVKYLIINIGCAYKISLFGKP